MTTNRDMRAAPTTPDHAGHDLVLIAAHAAGDTAPAEAARASALIAACSECRSLAADLAAIAAASRSLAAPRRSRDFRLAPETAARLRNRSPLRRLVDGLTAPRGFGRPLAGALMTLGLAGLLVSVLPGFPGGAATALHDLTSGERAASVPASNFAAGGSPAAPGVVEGGSGNTSTGTSDSSKNAPSAGPGGAGPAPAVGAASPPPAVGAASPPVARAASAPPGGPGTPAPAAGAESSPPAPALGAASPPAAPVASPPAALVASAPPGGPGTPAPADRAPATAAGDAASSPVAAAGQPQATSGAPVTPSAAPEPAPGQSPLTLVSGALLVAGIVLLLVRRAGPGFGAGTRI